MTVDDKGQVRAVMWSELFPWLCLVRTFRLAVSARLLLLGAAGVLLTQLGWYVAGLLLVPGGGDMACPWANTLEFVPDWEGSPSWQVERPGGVAAGAADAAGPMYLVWRRLADPVFRLFHPGLSLAGLANAVLCMIWALLVWSFFGAAITRTAAVRLAADEQLSWSATTGHLKSKWRAYFAAPLFPLAGVLLATIPMAVLGLLLRLDVGVVLVGLVWFLYLLGGLIMAVLLLGLMFGWPLMWPTISTEGTDSFDALSRSYAYVFQRPLHYLFYMIVAGVIGLLGWLLVYYMAAAVIALAYWAASWGAGSERIAAIASGENPLSVVVHFWTGGVKLLAVGYLYSFFWTASTAVYLLLRHDVDATEMDEVVLDDEADASYALPPLTTDEQGAPEAADESGSDDANSEKKGPASDSSEQGAPEPGQS
jgi:hypothetical protein